jgi:hypothetical protein
LYKALEESRYFGQALRLLAPDWYDSIKKTENHIDILEFVSQNPDIKKINSIKFGEIKELHTKENVKIEHFQEQVDNQDKLTQQEDKDKKMLPVIS